MKRFVLACAVVMTASGLATADPIVHQEAPEGVAVFDDASGNKGYVEVGDDGTVRACNENDSTPVGDPIGGYVWVNPGGDEPTPPTNGNGTIGAGDRSLGDGKDCA